MTLLFAGVLLLFLFQAPRISLVAGWIPFVVLGASLGLLCLQLALEFTKRRHSLGPTDNAAEAVRAIAWIVALLVAIQLAGAIVGAGIFCLVFLRRRARESWSLSAGLSLSLSLFLYLVFYVAFGTSLYSGMLQWP